VRPFPASVVGDDGELVGKQFGERIEVTEVPGIRAFHHGARAGSHRSRCERGFLGGVTNFAWGCGNPVVQGSASSGR
jgi:hypothetical protein